MSASTIDRELLASLRLIMEDEFTALLDAWWQDAGEKMEQLHEAVRNNNHDMLRRTAHSLKGSGSNLGLLDLSRVCQQIESTATTTDLSSQAARQMLADVQRAINTSAQALQQETGVEIIGA